MTALRYIVRGCGTLPGYGSHPGTGFVIFLVFMGAIAGAQRAGWRGALFGAVAMLVVFGPMYLYGAYDRGKASDRPQPSRT